MRFFADALGERIPLGVVELDASTARGVGSHAILVLAPSGTQEVEDGDDDDEEEQASEVLGGGHGVLQWWWKGLRIVYHVF